MKVFLDLDGCVVDFRRGICEAFGRDDPSNNWTFWENWEGVSSVDVNTKCDVKFWADLEWTREGREIEEIIRRKFGSGTIYLLTTPMPNLGSYTGKAMWVNKHLSLYNKRLIITQAPKYLFAGPDRLLIDDKDENIAEFKAAGGQGILVPRPWNRLRGWSDMTLKVVRDNLEAL